MHRKIEVKGEKESLFRVDDLWTLVGCFCCSRVHGSWARYRERWKNFRLLIPNFDRSDLPHSAYRFLHSPCMSKRALESKTF